MRKIIGMMLTVAFLLIGANGFAADEPVIWKDGKLNVNGATKELLIQVGVEENMADAILEAREEAGEFVDIEELMEIDGVDAAKLRELKRLLYVEEIPDCGC
ncbi:MAG: ComEA family DNA-binding protein [Desulfopila sp.]